MPHLQLNVNSLFLEKMEIQTFLNQIIDKKIFCQIKLC
jgi:hypothetical protein